ncbi:hypothetical protein D1007_56069 [Hordeum vulgare]|nr:hypothetical protein D1007_56069 [Hordeum vulgare]
MDEAAMVAMRADPQILELHLTVEATNVASRAAAAMRLAALNNNSLCFLEGSTCAFDDDYELFSQHAHAFLNSRANSLVLGQGESTHHHEEGTQNSEASPSSKPFIINIFNDEE